jgi:hypothetical protein
MSSELFAKVNAGWPVLLCTGLLLGFVTLRATQERHHLLWFLPVLLGAAIAFILVTGEPVSTPLLAAEQLGIGVVAVIPAVALAFAVAWCGLRYRAPGWLLVAGPAAVCLVSSPLVGYIALVAICELTGDCL